MARVPSDMGGTPMPRGTGVPPVRVGAAAVKTKDRAHPGKGVIESDVSGLEAGSKAAASGLGMMR